MPAINAVYSRNNLTIFSTSIIQASRRLPKQALNAVYSRLNHFRTSLSVIIKLCRFAEVPPLHFFFLFHYRILFLWHFFYSLFFVYIQSNLVRRYLVVKPLM